VTTEAVPVPPAAAADAAPLRAAVAGLGRSGVRHAALLAALPGVELVALADPSGRARARLRGFGFGAPAFGDDADMLARARPALVCVCAPQGRRAEVARRVLEAGAAAWVERPFSHALASAEPVFALAGERGLAIGCPFALGHQPVFAEAARAVRVGAIGAVRRARAATYVSRIFNAAASRRYRAGQVAGGAFAHVGIDLLAYVTDLLGDPAEVRATASRLYGEVEDELHAMLTLPGGLEVGIDASWSVPGHPHPDHVLEFEGTNGRLLASDDALELDLLAPAGGWPAGATRIHDATLVQPARFVYESESTSHAFASFVGAVRAGDPPRPGVAQALRVQRVLDTIYASVRSGGVSRSVAK
jgi:predicted dehydrogenase